MENRYAEYPDCPQSCTRMDVDAKFKIKTRSSSPKIGILLQRELMVIEEYYARSLISTGEVSITDHGSRITINASVAEVGGYLGMLLGVSLLDLQNLVHLIFSR